MICHHDRWRRATFFAFFGSIGTGYLLGDAVIWLLMVSTASKSFDSARSR